ncbi:MAG: TraB/GumN family protein, partial [Sphingomonadales bacterium]|nr:TraB/GumN family protein [Sphingomonadales bacterium]
PLDHDAIAQMRLDDFIDVRLIDIAVPDGLRVHHCDRATRATVKTARAVDAHAARPEQAEGLGARLATGKSVFGLVVGAAGFATFTLTVLPLRSLGYDPESGADRLIEATARAQGKKLAGLETSAQQIGFFSSLPDALQLELLSETLDELPTLPETIEQMIGAWAAGEPDRLSAIMNESVDSDPVLEKRLLTDRNSNWAEWIKARMDRPGVVFMAVGAGHLAGKGSVQDMLAVRGITTRRVRKVR